jgi:ElaB/YqjD/DUF883 family membrane-anchored ribosome-binding protein
MANTTVEDAARAVEQKIDATREAAASGAGRVRERVSEVAGNVKARANALRDKIADTEWEDVKSNVAGYVRDNPGRSIALALGVGFAVGLLLRRRDD